MAREAVARDQIEDLRPDGQPIRTTSKLTRNNGSFHMRLMKRAVDESGREPENPGEIDQYYYEDEELVVIDLSPNE